MAALRDLHEWRIGVPSIATMATIDLNRAAMFVRVVENGSFTNAARTLSVPTSSVSRAVAALEEELGVLLLQRTTRKLVLTTGGAAFYERAREAIALFADAAEAALDDKAPRGLVRVTAPTEMSAYLARHLTEFRAQYPDIRIDAVLTSRFVDMLGEGVDIALRAGVIEDTSLIARKVTSSAAGLYASPEYLGRRGTPATLTELAQHDCVVRRSKGDKTTWDLEGPGGASRVVVHGSLIGDGLGFVMSAVVAGAGISLVPISRAKELEAEKLVVRVLPDYTTQGADFSVVVTSRQIPQRVTLLRDYLVQALLREDLTLCPKIRGDELAAHGSPLPRHATRVKLVAEAAAE